MAKTEVDNTKLMVLIREEVRNALDEREESQSGGAGDSSSSFSFGAVRSRAQIFARAASQAAQPGARGQLGGMLGLAHAGAKEIESVLQSKTFERVLEGATAKLLGNPAVGARVFSAISKGLSVAGPVGLVASIAYGVTSSVVNARNAAADARNAAQGSSFDLALKNRINVASMGMQSRQISQDVAGQQSFIGKVMDYLGFDESNTKEVERRKNQRVNNQVRARNAAPELIGQRNVSNALIKFAQKRGKTVGELTERERAQALDEAVADAINPTLGENSSRNRTNLAVGLDAPIYAAAYGFASEKKRTLMRQQLFEDKTLPDNILKPAEGARERQEREAEKRREELFDTPQKVAKFRSAVQKEQTDFQAVRDRMRPVELD